MKITYLAASLLLLITGCTGSSTPISISDEPADPTYTIDNPRTIQAFEEMSVILNKGTALAWGKAKDLKSIDNLHALIKSIAIDTDGKIIFLQNDPNLEELLHNVVSTSIKYIDWKLERYSSEGRFVAVTETGELIGGPISPPLMQGKYVSTALSANSSIALREDGSVFQWDQDGNEAWQVAPDSGRIVKIAAGDKHFIALFEDGRVATWRDIRKGINLGCGLLSPCPDYRPPKPNFTPPYITPSYLTLLTGAIDISASDNVNAVVLADGSVQFWGEYSEDFIPPVELSDIVEISISGVGGYGKSGDYGTTDTQGIAKTTSGEIVTWGGIGIATKNASELSNIEKIAPNFGWLTQDGKLFNYATAYTRKIKIDDNQTYDPIIAVTQRQLKIGVLEGESGNVYVETPTHWTERGYDYTLTTFEEVLSYSTNAEIIAYTNRPGELHHYPDSNSLWEDAFSRISFEPTINKISLSDHHALALLNDHSVISWGINIEFGENKVPEFNDEIIDIFAGNGFSIALTKNGRIIYWGKDEKLISERFYLFPPIKAIGSNGYALITKNNEPILWNSDIATPKDLGPIKDAIVEQGIVYALTTDNRIRAWSENNSFNIGKEIYESIRFSQVN
ncbi:hypothetical protein [Marinagarivorans cellulosilyticus]|uniref:Uncharacterized protein n=1 Tax=Marinagarivorans cellulosilyticus TaxID=2721545 RepID=A0AAN1WEU0_9GAMM|nr:hypothetical protein [Marinagarivorans cellulosilyticus]BCD96283.1 hypothetical protein MARGE09_P0483 [Marinagarivorans cellulosilyticus]